jgi:hypothetical protein
MKEVFTEMKTYAVKAMCDCGEGELVSTGKVFFSSPMQLVHKCTACGIEVKLDKYYPGTERRPA